MTSNQVAYQSNLESQRHNEIVETETNRHNLVVENLEKENVRLNEMRITYENEWNQRKNDIQEQYNQAYLEYQKASTKEKLRIENELKDIRNNEQIAQADYYQKTYEVNVLKNQLQADINKETNRHNEALETIEATRALKQNWWYEKELDYKNRALDHTISFDTNKLELQNFEYMTNVERMWNDYELGMTRISNEFTLGQERNKIAGNQVITNGIIGGINAGINTLKVIPLFGF